MMLHEAVMLEIYRQALSASELTSPRCQSRESNNSTTQNDVRCPSNESHCSANDCLTPAPTPTPTSPVGLPLPATLTPAAAAALLPPQSAAMAAYLNAAAAAAAQQNHHLLLTNPLAAAATLVQQATQQQQQQQQVPHAPHATSNGLKREEDDEEEESSVLDFSRTRRISAHASDEDELEQELKGEQLTAGIELTDAQLADDGNSRPLDLSLTTRKRPLCHDATDAESEDARAQGMLPARKLSRIYEYKSPAPAAATAAAPGTWVPPINPYLAAVAAASLSPKTHLTLVEQWQNGNANNNNNSSNLNNNNSNNSNSKCSKLVPTNEASKALEKMTEMTLLGAATEPLESHAAHGTRNQSSSSSSSNNNSSGSGSGSSGRHSAWQSHWLNKGADAAKDVFKCVWCKQSFPTLATLTAHMKETQHCGVNMPPAGAVNLPAASACNSGARSNDGSQQLSTAAARHTNQNVTSANAANGSGSGNGTGACSGSGSGNGGSTSKSELNMLIKETMPLPRKLVRGQDVWLGKGAEQTRQILKCMWCGQSFRSLAEMTSHMQETQHYTNIISQEQIISWKSGDEKHSNASNAATAANNCTAAGTAAGGAAAANGSANNSATVSAVLTCKVCEQAFPTLKELSNHMVKNNHYKEHMLRSSSSSGSGSSATLSSHAAANAMAAGNVSPTPAKRGRQPREKRKKSLPVRKLLELERAQHDYKNNSLDSALKPLRDFAASTKITCEKCGAKIETALFVEHIRKCLGDSIPIPPRKHAAINERLPSPRTPSSLNSAELTSSSPLSSRAAELHYPMSMKDCLTEKSASSSGSSTTAPSVLNAIEQLIEKSFDTRPTRGGSASGGCYGGSGDAQLHNNAPLGSSILKRLGIDDSSDYTKPLMDNTAMNFLRSYTNYTLSRDRSASESSSISERCNSRIEAYTPERASAALAVAASSAEQLRQLTPRQTPEQATEKGEAAVVEASSLRIKSEPQDVAAGDSMETEPKISVKKEFSMPDDLTVAEHSEENACSVSERSERSERSETPKSSCSDKKLGGNSLVALSSMFNNLHSMSSSAGYHAAEANNSNNNNGGGGGGSSTLAANASKKANANPLAALQKLCDTTTTNNNNNNNSSSTDSVASNGRSAGLAAAAAVSGSNNNANSGGGSSNMLAFSWACTDAIMTADSIIKCAFCDTPFCSKGAYRHHLSKMHFVKDANEPTSSSDSQSSASLALKSPSLQAQSPKRSMSRSPAAATPLAGSPAAAVTNSSSNGAPIINPYDESAQSKFLKYTELAKQLSSKNA